MTRCIHYNALSPVNQHTITEFSHRFCQSQDISKGLVVKSIMATMQAKGKPSDFVLCIGDDRSDEDMFESIASSVANHSLPEMAEVFACTVGQKPSMAKYYLDDTVEVLKMLHGLSAAATSQPSPKPSPSPREVSFEGSL